MFDLNDNGQLDPLEVGLGMSLFYGAGAMLSEAEEREYAAREALDRDRESDRDTIRHTWDYDDDDDDDSWDDDDYDYEDDPSVFWVPDLKCLECVYFGYSGEHTKSGPHCRDCWDAEYRDKQKQ